MSRCLELHGTMERLLPIAGAERPAHADQLAMFDLGAHKSATVEDEEGVFHGGKIKKSTFGRRANKNLIQVTFY